MRGNWKLGAIARTELLYSRGQAAQLNENSSRTKVDVPRDEKLM